MIIMTGSPFDITPLAGEYPENSLERQLLHRMHESDERYIYASVDTLKFELGLRREIINAAVALNKSRFDFSVFHKSKSNPDYWERTPNGGFRMKESVKPGDAINDIFINSDQYATECATAMMIVYYKALLEMFGQDRFNSVFTQIYLMNWVITEPLLKEAGRLKKAEILPGDRGYFQNPEVNPVTPEWQGENVIVLPDSRYYGHGIGIATADRIIRALNSNRKRDATISAYMLDTVGRPDFKKLEEAYRIHGGQAPDRITA
ncbi:MAG: hypothetical protein K0S55_1128 [Clostridia bacterium]|nr:hypothetical protein [Clostridia bacterium]